MASQVKVAVIDNKIKVAVTSGARNLGGLGDVELSSVKEDDTLLYDSVAGKFKNQDNHAVATHLKVRNISGATMNTGDAVALVGYSVGQEAIEVILADQTTSLSFGLIEEPLLNNENGFIIISGVMEGVDTSAFTEGNVLYVNSTGKLTETEPTTGFMQPIAFVLRSHASSGVIQILADYPKQDATDVRYTGTLLSTNVKEALNELHALILAP